LTCRVALREFGTPDTKAFLKPQAKQSVKARFPHAKLGPRRK